jgi:catechol 2,3-dioxygenase-like lactoylglutathione lyase family enzyme
MMKAGFSTPMLRVRDVDRSILFYEQLGFSLVDSEGKRAWVYERSTKFQKNGIIGKFIRMGSLRPRQAAAFGMLPITFWHAS